jgi:hypothetical protein
MLLDTRVIALSVDQPFQHPKDVPAMASKHYIHLDTLFITVHSHRAVLYSYRCIP